MLASVGEGLIAFAVQPSRAYGVVAPSPAELDSASLSMLTLTS
jgi:hypothetical protein